MTDPILLKYSRHVGFPFDDWLDQIVSFYALMSFWSDVFRADVANAESEFGPMLDLEQVPDGPVFAVASHDMRRALRVTHVSQDKALTHCGFFVSGRLNAQLERIPDAFTLDIATDLSEHRMHVIRTLIRQQMGGPHRSLERRNEELDALITSSSDLFPAMMDTTRAALDARMREEQG